MQTIPNSVIFFPPPIEEVRMYFTQRGLIKEEAECFFLFHGFKGWKNRNGKYPKNWKLLAYAWINNILKHESC